MAQDQLSPEDRALYQAFFAAYGEAYEKQCNAGAEDISLDACTVYAIRAMVERERNAPRIVEGVGRGTRFVEDPVAEIEGGQ